MKNIITTLVFTGIFATASAQVKIPAPSPSATVKQSIGLSDITVEYSRPSANDRKIFGTLVPMKTLWRTGANGSTDITFSGDAEINGKKISAGKYALYTIPGATEWEIILYKDTEQWGAPEALEEDQIVARSKVKVEKNPVFAESFEIGFNDLKTDKANLILKWENTMVRIPVFMDSRKQVLESIGNTLGSTTAKGGDYHQAASYYFQENLDMKKALEYSKKANELQPDTFYMLKQQAEIEAANGMKKEAIATAKKSLELATKAKNADYVKINNDNISKWSKK